MSNKIALKNRSLIEIFGDDRKKFLQGLITNDINKVNDKSLIYSAMLNAQGRFLYDFFIFEKNDSLFLDCDAKRREEILQKFNLYKLRAKILVKKNDDLSIVWNLENGQFIDPRHQNLGYRSYEKLEISAESTLDYHKNRISLKIPESEEDLTYEKSIILEFGFDNLNAISYNKGCYIGQELTSRTHFKGEIRKKIFHLKINGLNFIEKNHEITCEGKSVGIILSHIFTPSALETLALIKISEQDEFQHFLEKLEVKNHENSSKITVIN